MVEITQGANDVDSMGLEDLKILRTKAVKRIKAIRRATKIHMEVVIPAELAIDIDTVIEWAYTNKLIKRQTRWSFSKFAVVNTVNMILQRIKEEKAAKAQTGGEEVPRTQLDAQTQARDISTEDKRA